MLTWRDVIKFAKEGNPKPDRIIEKSEEEWRAMLTSEQYHVTRKKGTERAFSSEMCSLFEPGKYGCICCNTLLFDASTKFESRVETVCNVCQAHLGHVFPDGPEPSGLRYCMNAVALKKMEESY
jgi:peptide methionine sulfoxide reductase MsrB